MKKLVFVFYCGELVVELNSVIRDTRENGRRDRLLLQLHLCELKKRGKRTKL